MTGETPNPNLLDSATQVASVADTPAAGAPPSGVGDAPAAAPSAEGQKPSADLDAAKAAAAAPSFLNQTDEEKPKAPEVAAKPDAAKEAPPAKEGEAAPAAEATPAVEPIAYDFKLPDTIKIDDAQRTELSTILDGFRADPAKGVQGLVDLHAKYVGDAVQSAAKQMEIRQYEVFNETRTTWRNQMAADEEIGGSGLKTSRTTALAAINRFVPAKHREAFESMLYTTGVGDHPEFVRSWNEVGKFMKEPGLPPANIKPVPNAGGNPGASKTERLYGKTG